VSDKPQHPNNPLLSKFQAIDSKEVTKASWEHSRVMHIVQVMGYKNLVSDLKRVSQGSLFTLGDFVQVCDDFPVYLFAETLKGSPPIHRDNRSVHPIWFKSFTSVPFVKVYIERSKTFPTDRPVGMLFPRRGFQQGMIIHDGDPERFLPPGSSCHLYRGDGGTTMIVQPFTGFLNHLKTF